MFQLDAFLDDCLAASREHEPRLAMKDVLTKAVSRPDELAAALPPERAGIDRLYVSDDLTVLKVVWAPGMMLGPHDHRTWAAIGLYSGGEDNALFRRDGRRLVASGGRELRTRDVFLLGDDAVHSVTNPTKEFAGAIHIYGGDFFAIPRSEWMGDPPEEQPYNVERVLALFEASNAAHENANSTQ